MADDAVVVLWLSQWNRYALIQELQEVFRHPYEALSPELAATYDRLKPQDFFNAGGCRTTAVRPEPRLAVSGLDQPEGLAAANHRLAAEAAIETHQPGAVVHGQRQ